MGRLLAKALARFIDEFNPPYAATPELAADYFWLFISIEEPLALDCVQLPLDEREKHSFYSYVAVRNQVLQASFDPGEYLYTVLRQCGHEFDDMGNPIETLSTDELH